MCIKQVTAWEHGGQFFGTELEAVNAALHDLGVKLVRDHSAHMAAGLIEHGDKLSALLDRHQALTAMAAAKPKALAA